MDAVLESYEQMGSGCQCGKHPPDMPCFGLVSEVFGKPDQTRRASHRDGDGGNGACFNEGAHQGIGFVTGWAGRSETQGAGDIRADRCSEASVQDHRGRGRALLGAEGEGDGEQQKATCTTHTASRLSPAVRVWPWVASGILGWVHGASDRRRRSPAAGANPPHQRSAPGPSRPPETGSAE